MSALLSCEDVKALLDYDPSFGVFIWRVRTPLMFRDGPKSRFHECRIWNAKYAGRLAGRVNPSTGYIEIALWGRRYQAHRLAVAIMTGFWPPQLVDHINHQRSDNRWENLRRVDHAGNGANGSSHRDSTSMYLGVSFDKLRNKWAARLCIQGRKMALGRFQTEEQASLAYQAAKARFLSQMEVR